MECKYRRLRELPPGEELDRAIREHAIYTRRAKVPRWSTDQRLLRALMDSLAEYANSSLAINLDPVRSGDPPLWKPRWSVTLEFPGIPGTEYDAFTQEGEGETLNLALCRALLHIRCHDDDCGDCSGPVTTALVGDFSAGAVLIRQDEAAQLHGDTDDPFVRNMQTILAELRERRLQPPDGSAGTLWGMRVTETTPL
jgi:hypothetical protein